MTKLLSSVQNPLVKRLAKLRKERHFRDQERALVIEGHKLVEEVCEQVEAHLIFVTDPAFLTPKMQAKHTCIVTPEIIEKIAGSKHPEGIVAEVPMPCPASLEGKRFLIALDGVADPGNLGTLLRTALALGWEGAFILENSCDPFNDKALRSAKGATFRLPIQRGNWEELETLVQSQHLQPFCADIKGTAIDNIGQVKSALLVLGNESVGPSENAVKLSQRITIPMSGSMESLNVSIAGAILMYTISKNSFHI